MPEEQKGHKLTVVKIPEGDWPKQERTLSFQHVRTREAKDQG